MEEFLSATVEGGGDGGEIVEGPAALPGPVGGTGEEVFEGAAAFFVLSPGDAGGDVVGAAGGDGEGGGAGDVVGAEFGGEAFADEAGGLFGHGAVGGVFAALDLEDAVGAEFDLVLAAGGAGAFAGGGEQGPEGAEAAKGGQVGAGREELARDGAEVGDFVGGDVDGVGGAGMVHIGGADEGGGGEIAPGDEEDDAAVGVEVGDGVIAFVKAGEDDVRTADEAQAGAGHPGAAGIDDARGVEARAIGEDDAIGQELGDFDAGLAYSAVVAGVADVVDDEGGGITGGVPIGKAVAEVGALADAVAAGEEIVKSDADAVEGFVEEAGGGELKAEGADGVGGEFEQAGAFAQGLADEAEVEVFEVAEAAVDEVGIAAAGAVAPEVFLEEEDAGSAAGVAPAEGEVAGQAGAVDAAADDDDVEVLPGERLARMHRLMLTTQASRLRAANQRCCGRP